MNTQQKDNQNYIRGEVEELHQKAEEPQRTVKQAEICNSSEEPRKVLEWRYLFSLLVLIVLIDVFMALYFQAQP